MERRKRVESIMNSKIFREELERIIETQMKDGSNSVGLLQEISDMFGSKYNNNNALGRCKRFLLISKFRLLRVYRFYS